MRVLIAKDYDELSEKAFEVMKDIIRSNPYAVLGLATGTTPLGLYRHMIEDHKAHGTSYAHIRTVNLDEYQGLPKNHNQSYAYFMRENLFRHLDIETSNTYMRTARRRTSKRSAHGIINCSKNYPVIFSYWAWAVTGISRLTNRARRSGVKRTWST